MNHQLWTRVGARVLAIMFVVAGAAACGDDDTRVSANSTAANGANGSSSASGSLEARKERSGLPDEASPSAVVIGTAPAQPQGDTPETTPSSASQSQLSKASESQSMPREGDNHSYSTTDPNSPQKAGGSDPVAQRSQ